jgi:hypothetical protein
MTLTEDGLKMPLGGPRSGGQLAAGALDLELRKV